MALIQYITKKRKKQVLSLQDLNIIKQKINAVYKEGEAFYIGAILNCQKTLDLMPYEFERVGVMIAATPSKPKESKPGIILIGYSLCHKVDRFDHKKIQVSEQFDYFDPDPGLGKSIALARAMKWSQAEDYPAMIKYAKAVPDSIRKDLKNFIIRALKYYKDDQLPGWAAEFMNYDQK